jgi:hypothetical protein
MRMNNSEIMDRIESTSTELKAISDNLLTISNAGAAGMIDSPQISKALSVDIAALDRIIEELEKLCSGDQAE